MNYNCPQCKNKLEKVTQDNNSPLSSEQFDAAKAGDYFCRTCKSNEGKSGYKYYWKSQLQKIIFGAQLNLSLN